MCITYNHGAYIRDAINGALSQIANFTYEILVHDDASTDETPAIIDQYAKDNPKLIFPILESNNQFSQGVSVFNETMRKARGRYIAVLEGDDCWIDPEKLQTEYDWMESHPDYSACLHNAYVVDYMMQAIYYSELPDGDRDKTLDDLIIEGGGVINPTASFFFRKALLDRMIYTGPVGDHFWFMAAAMHGKVRWFSKPMSIYRIGTPGSFTCRFAHRTLDQSRLYLKRYLGALHEVELDAGTDHAESFRRRRDIQTKLFYDESASSLTIADLKNLSLGYRAKLVIKKLYAKTIPISIRSRIRHRRDLKRIKCNGLLISDNLFGQLSMESILQSVKRDL